MSAEAYSFMDGAVFVWTGTTAASATVAYAEQTQLVLSRAWENRATLGDCYQDTLVNKRADLTVAALYTFNDTFARLHDAETAVHMKFQHESVNGSAGYLLYSGRIDSLTYNGEQDGLVRCTLQAHFNAWSGFGGG